VWIQPMADLDNLGQPQLSGSSRGEKSTQIEVDLDGDNLDNLDLIHRSGSSASAFYAPTPDIPTHSIEKVVQVGQVGPSLDEPGFQLGQPAESGLSELARCDATELAPLQVGERIAIWKQDHWQSATLIALPNYHPNPRQNIAGWKAQLDTGPETYVWDIQNIRLLNDKKG
jgi:hypothetical protein